MNARGSSPARPASESPRRRKPREASATYGDLSETASACVSGARVFWIAASRMQGIGAALLERSPRPAAFWAVVFAAGCHWRQRVGFTACERPVRRGGICVLQQHVSTHDVSIPMMVTEGCRYRGCIPRSKNSMTIMRPPQHGHGGKSFSAGSSWLGLAGVSAGGGAEPSSWRSRAMLAAQKSQSELSADR